MQITLQLIQGGVRSSSSSVLNHPLGEIRPFEIDAAAASKPSSAAATNVDTPSSSSSSSANKLRNLGTKTTSSSSPSSSLTSEVSLPSPPPLNDAILSQADISRLEEPWKWFESSGEHKDLLEKVRSLRAAKGSPLVILDIGLNIGSAPFAIERVCPDCIIYGFEPIPKYFAFAKHKMPQTNIQIFICIIMQSVMRLGPNLFGWMYNQTLGMLISLSLILIQSNSHVQFKLISL